MANDNPECAGTLPSRFGTRHRSAKSAATGGRGSPGNYLVRAVFSLALAILFSGAAQAADKLRLEVQKTGTFAWELAILHALGLDKKAGLDIAVTELASPEAAKVALLGGSADIILSDWLWVARQRNLGGRLVFVPYSTALGAVMVGADSPVKDLVGLRGKKIAVAGGPLDKSWLLLQALAREQRFDIVSEATVIYGAPPLLYQKALNGETDATLNYWTFCVALESRGFRRLIGMEEIEKNLGAKGPVAMVGYVFDGGFAKSHADALARFFDIVAQANDILAHSDAEWENIAARIGITNKAQLALFRQTYIEGIPRRRVAEEAADARILYHALVTAGGADLAGPAKELDEETYYKGPTGLAPGAN